MAPRVALVLAATVTLAAFAQAALSYSSVSVLTTSVTSPAAQFGAGAGATNSRYVTGFATSANKTSFTGTFDGKAGADLTVKDVVRLTNADTVSRSITLRASQVTNANIQVFTWTVKNGSTTIGTFDYKGPTPTLTFTVPGSTTYKLDERLKLARGSGNHDTSVAFTLGVAST